MITRARIRRGACWVGVVAGVVSLGALITSVFKRISLASDPQRDVAIERGSFSVTWQRSWPGFFMGPAPPTYWRWLPRWRDPEWMYAGSNPIMTPGEFIMPLWIPAAFGLLCLYWLVPERGPRFICVKCGYDLRGVPRKDGGWVCPECGTRSA